MKKKTFSCDFAGRKLEVEFSNLVEQANGSALVKYGDTVILATATMSNSLREGLGYFPLTVDYEEKFYAVGKILGSRFMRREGRSSDNATLTGRVIDRTIRPLFNSKMRNDIQVIANVLSYDEEVSPDVPAVLAASLALGTSDIPWGGPIAGARIIKKDGEFIINPTVQQKSGADLETFICGKDGKINMIEAFAKEIPEDEAIKAFKLAVKEIDKINDFQKTIIKEIGKEKITPEIPQEPEELRDVFEKHIKPRLEDYIYIDEKTGRTTRLNELKKEWIESAQERFGEGLRSVYDDLYEEMIDEIMHKNILEEDKRPDHRKLSEVRSLYADTGVLPRAHGSGIFYRGQTHQMSVLTLGSPADHKLIDGIEEAGKKYFMHHYNFPPYSSGETKPLRGPGRREIGHGALAEKALSAVIPSIDEFPYTIRIVSESMSSNGSTSMASVCASTMALMDAGVPIKNPVAGIAMGLVMESEKSYKVLTDIQGPEDHHGDMDFKAAGTKNGLTAIQMDVKIDGIPVEILGVALDDAKTAREHILKTMLEALPEPRKELSKYAPKIVVHKIDPNKIGELIGSGGKTINGIIEESGAGIDIEEDGSVFITSIDQEAINKALEMVEQITRDIEIGDTFKGAVVKTMDFGAFVKLTPKQDGLIHISRLSRNHVNKVTDIVKEGDVVEVKVLDIDDRGKISLALISNGGGISKKEHKSGEDKK